jgi:DNA repair protein RecO (recombination protein O)
VKQQVTFGIVLTRTDYGEADRIVTFITPDYGKIHVMARGVRKIKSKMAGGIELFSVSEITYMQGRGELARLLSARLQTHYGNIVRDITRVQLGYALIKMLHRATEDQTDASYFDLINRSLRALDDDRIPDTLIDAWFQSQLLKLEGRSPNLVVVADSHEGQFNFDYESVSFRPFSTGSYNANHIKVMRLLFSEYPPERIVNVQGTLDLLPTLMPLIAILRRDYLKQ